MPYIELADDPEDTRYSAAERASAASRSTWVSVGVNIALTFTQIGVGIFAKSQGLIADGIHSLSDLVAVTRHQQLNLMELCGYGEIISKAH